MDEPRDQLGSEDRDVGRRLEPLLDLRSDDRLQQRAIDALRQTKDVPGRKPELERPWWKRSLSIPVPLIAGFALLILVLLLLPDAPMQSPQVEPNRVSVPSQGELADVDSGSGPRAEYVYVAGAGLVPSGLGYPSRP